MTSTFLSYNKG